MANILRMIEEHKFEITGMRMMMMDHSSVVRLLEIYHGVVSEYPVSCILTPLGIEHRSPACWTGKHDD